MRRRAQTKGAQHMAEHALLIFLAHPERREHFRLQIRFVNSNAAAADFHAVQDDVVGFRAHFAEFLRFELSRRLRPSVA